MKKKIFGAVLIVAIAAGAMINVNLNKVSNKGDLTLANVEALAQQAEYGQETVYCTTLAQSISCDMQYCNGYSQKAWESVVYVCGNGNDASKCTPGTSTIWYDCDGNAHAPSFVAVPRSAVTCS
jgi:hypothetical protein